ncbi:hypothetical protein L6164_016560 [Bauhinia variegata]|uniref:Uncharacterized protein n=1 Tax=Bauhinia variegata TaxID=167791 RepID=A0ACB9NQG3_BAUVA|nr:hypothetical protein L6164_016560 [Bauhinia variegata]
MSHQNTLGLEETNTIHGCSKQRYNSYTDTTTPIGLSDSLPSLFLPEDLITEILLSLPVNPSFDSNACASHGKPYFLIHNSPRSNFTDQRSIPNSRITDWCTPHDLIVIGDRALSRIVRIRNNVSFHLYNPCTGWKSRIAYYFHQKTSSAFGCGYDDLTDRYKVVSLYLDSFNDLYGIEIKVCTFGDHHSLRRYRSFSVPRFGVKTLAKCLGTFLRGTLNWLVEDLASEFILSFHLGNETFGKVLLPVDEDFCHSYHSCIGVLKDCLYFSADNVAKTQFIVWLMKDYGVEDSWTKLITISYLDFDIKKRPNYQGRIKLISMSEDGQVLFHIRDHKFALHNSKDNKLEYFEIEGFHG